MSSNAFDTLIVFLAKMKKWEAGFCAAQEEADENDTDVTSIKEQYASELKEILDFHSLDYSLNKDRLIDLGSANPVTYDPDRDEVEVEKGSDEVYIVKQKAGFKSVFRFSMVLQHESWWIQKKERLNDAGQWVPSTL